MPTRDQLYTALQRADAAGDTEAARRIAQQLAATPATAQPTPSGVSNTDAALIGAGKGLTDVAGGLYQRGNEAYFEPDSGVGRAAAALLPGMSGIQGLFKAAGLSDKATATKQATTQKLIEDAALFQKLAKENGWATAGEIGAKALATAPLGVSAAAGAGTLARVGAGAASGALGGASEVAKDDKELARNVSMGAGFGGAVTGFLSMAGKTINGIRGRIDENSVAAKKLAEMVKAGFSDRNIGYADIMPGQAGDVARYADSAMAYVPGIGTAAKSAGQIDDVQNILGGLRARTAESVSGDVDEAIKGAVETARSFAREQSAANFDALQAMVPDTAIPMSNVQRVAEGFLQQKERIGDLIASKDEGLIEQLKRFATPRLSSYDEMRNGVREAISELIETAPNDNVKRMYTVLKNAAEKDIDNLFEEAGKNAPKVREAYAVAKAFHKENVVPFSQGALGTILRGGMEDLDRVVDDIAKAGKGRAFAKAYGLTDENGKRAMQLALIEKGLKAAEVTGEGGQVFWRPGAFAAQMNKLRKATGVLEGDSAKEVQGAINLMASLGKLDKLMGADAKTGATVAKYGAGVAGIAGAGVAPAAAAKAALSGSMFRFLFASKTGRNILLSAADQKTDSKAMRMLLDNAYQYTTQVGRLEAGEAIDE